MLAKSRFQLIRANTIQFLGAGPPHLELPPDLEAFLRNAMIKAETVLISEVSTGVLDVVTTKGGERLLMLPVLDHPYDPGGKLRYMLPSFCRADSGVQGGTHYNCTKAEGGELCLG